MPGAFGSGGAVDLKRAAFWCAWCRWWCIRLGWSLVGRRGAPLGDMSVGGDGGGHLERTRHACSAWRVRLGALSGSERHMFAPLSSDMSFLSGDGDVVLHARGGLFGL